MLDANDNRDRQSEGHYIQPWVGMRLLSFVSSSVRSTSFYACWSSRSDIFRRHVKKSWKEENANRKQQIKTTPWSQAIRRFRETAREKDLATVPWSRYLMERRAITSITSPVKCSRNPSTCLYMLKCSIPTKKPRKGITMKENARRRNCRPGVFW